MNEQMMLELTAQDAIKCFGDSIKHREKVLHNSRDVSFDEFQKANLEVEMARRSLMNIIEYATGSSI